MWLVWSQIQTSFPWHFLSVRQDPSQLSSLSLAQYWLVIMLFFLIKRGQMLAGFPCIQCCGRQQCHTLFDQTASDRWTTHRQTEGRCFTHSDAFSSEIHSVSCELKDNYETLRDVFCYWYIFGGKPGFPWHPWIHTTDGDWTTWEVK